MVRSIHFLKKKVLIDKFYKAWFIYPAEYYEIIKKKNEEHVPNILSDKKLKNIMHKNMLLCLDTSGIGNVGDGGRC